MKQSGVEMQWAGLGGIRPRTGLTQRIDGIWKEPERESRGITAAIKMWRLNWHRIYKGGEEPAQAKANKPLAPSAG